MHRRNSGFTLIELLIVIAIIAIIAVIGVPSLLTARMNSNETAAIATLRTLVAAQAQFQKAARADMNTNGFGEYGTFGELSGMVPVRGGLILNPAVLSTAFRTVTATGEVSRNGYFYAIYLPDAAGDGLPEVGGGGADPSVDADLSETVWCCYAWPGHFGGTGRSTFFVNQSGDIVKAEAPAYSGPGAGPAPGAGFTPGPGNTITGRMATGLVGRDGNLWRGVG